MCVGASTRDPAKVTQLNPGGTQPRGYATFASPKPGTQDGAQRLSQGDKPRQPVGPRYGTTTVNPQDPYYGLKVPGSKGVAKGNRPPAEARNRAPTAPRVNKRGEKFYEGGAPMSAYGKKVEWDKVIVPGKVSVPVYKQGVGWQTETRNTDGKTYSIKYLSPDGIHDPEGKPIPLSTVSNGMGLQKDGSVLFAAWAASNSEGTGMDYKDYYLATPDPKGEFVLAPAAANKDPTMVGMTNYGWDSPTGRQADSAQTPNLGTAKRIGDFYRGGAPVYKPLKKEVRTPERSLNKRVASRSSVVSNFKSTLQSPLSSGGRSGVNVPQ